MTCPDGFKPVTHRQCGKVVAWVKDEVGPGMRMRSADILTLEGEDVLPMSTLSSVLKCPDCQNLVHPRGYRI